MGHNLVGRLRSNQCTGDDRITQDPGRGELNEAQTPFGRQLIQPIGSFDGSGEGFALESVELRSLIVVGEDMAGLVASSKETLGLGGVGENANAVIPAEWQHIGFDFPVEHIVARLVGMIGVEFVGRIELFHVVVGYTGVTGLAFFLQLGEGAHLFFERDVPAPTVDLVEVDIVSFKRPQALLHRRAHCGSRIISTADLGGEKAAIPIASSQGLSDDRLAGPVGLRRIDESDAVVDRAMDGVDCDCFIDLPHSATQRPGTEAEDWNFRAVIT